MNWNHETAQTALLIDNDRAALEYWTARALEALANPNPVTECSIDAPRNHRQVAALAEALKEEIEAQVIREIDKLAPDSIASALAASALQEIEWRQLAAHYLTKTKELDQ